MEEEVYLTILYDYYGALLTEKQRLYFTYYYFDNLSLQEIKENLDVSRNAIHKELKIIKDKLYNYEEKLKLYDRDKKILKVVDSIDDVTIREKIKNILDNKLHNNNKINIQDINKNRINDIEELLK